MHMGRKGWIWLFSLALFACEKDIDIELDDTTEALVVDASIESGRPPLVFLSRSLAFFSEINPDILAGSFVRNAEVYISDGVNRHKLREDSVGTTAGSTIYFYSNDVSNPGTAIIGQFERQYDLEIISEGRTYTATTTIPAITRRVDSLWWEKVQDEEDSNLVKLIIRATDKPGFGNYIRYFTRVNQETFLPGVNSVFDDQVIDGTTYTFPVDKGFNKNLDQEDYEPFFHRGDTVTVKLAEIDRVTYDFWRTLEFSYQSVGNPFSSPVKVLGNISNGALGYFGGYATQFHTLVIPPR
ncbi:MAG: DUF4249 domain-containing protein [Chitinophagaceae bacterium]|jgi:hypothetical protein|nr:DUF4249 domain-containing protein [Chitinophagaceae bacterium]